MKEALRTGQLKSCWLKRLLVSTPSCHHGAGKNSPYKRYLSLKSLVLVTCPARHCPSEDFLPSAQSEPPKTWFVSGAPCISSEMMSPPIITWRAVTKPPPGHALMFSLPRSNLIGASLHGASTAPSSPDVNSDPAPWTGRACVCCVLTNYLKISQKK